MRFVSRMAHVKVDKLLLHVAYVEMSTRVKEASYKEIFSRCKPYLLVRGILI